MQKRNVNLPITVTGRHVEVTDSMRDYAQKKIEGLHLDYPKIIEAKALLDVAKNRQIAEIILFCANHITIEAQTETEDIYSAIDETISKIARRMRKYKTRMLMNSHRPRKKKMRSLPEEVYEEPDYEQGEEQDIEPVLIHNENYRIKNLYPDEAIMDMEMSERSFIIFHNGHRNDRLTLIHRRKDGEYGMIDLHED